MSPRGLLEGSLGFFLALGAVLSPREAREPEKNEKPDLGPPSGFHFVKVSGHVGAMLAHGNHILWPCTSMFASESLQSHMTAFLDPENTEKSLQDEAPEGPADS